MSIKKIHKYEHLFLIFASLLIAVVHTLPFFSSIFKATADHPNPFFNKHFILTRSLWYFLQSFISMLVFSYFNYNWKRFFVPRKTKAIFRIPLIVLYNFMLVAILIALTVLLAEYTTGNPFGIRGAINFYFWKYVFLNPLSLIVAYVLFLIQKKRAIEIENIKLKKEQLSSQLKTLKDQVNPHFLFNTLNTLSSVIRTGRKQDGLKFVDDLSSVYRYILESDRNNLVSVQAELGFLESYVFMLKKRFEDKLLIQIDLPGRIRKSLVPPMVLQVLVENALKHNEISQASPLRIDIFTESHCIVVRNNLQTKTTDQENLGLGLPNLVERYKLIAEKEVIITQTNTHFIVKLPVIKS